MSISRDDVEQLAELARIRLEEHEIEEFREDLERILEYVDTIEELETEDVEPTTHAIPLEMQGREDEVHEGLSRDEVLAEAPETEEGQFRVPKIVEDD